MTRIDSTKRRTGRRFFMSLGIVLILAGIGCLGYVGWQYYGTNIISKHKHDEVKAQLKQSWKTETEPSSGTEIGSDAIGLLRVPRFGKDYEVPIVRGFDDAALAKGIGWYKLGAMPGELGNFAIAGHRVTHGEPFRHFHQLRKGDTVIVETRKDIYKYKLRNNGDDITVDFTTSWPLNRVPEPGKADVEPKKHVLTMLTCSELFHTRNRNVVVGDLMSTTKKTQPAGG